MELTCTSQQHLEVDLAVFPLQYSELSSRAFVVSGGYGLGIESLPKFCKDPEHGRYLHNLRLNDETNLKHSFMEVHQGFSFEHGFISVKNFAERERPEEPEILIFIFPPSKQSSRQGNIIAC